MMRVAFVVLLMREHDRSKDVGAILGQREGLDRLHLRKRLKSILGDKARMVPLVVENGTRPCHTSQLCASPL